MIRTLKNKKGLTLIELIAVLVILGIIAAIAIPTIGNTISQQRQRAADAEWQNILTAGRLYIAENDTATTFSVDDLVTAGYLSGDVVMTDDGTIGDITGENVFLVGTNGVPEVDDANFPLINIDGLQVYP